MTRIGSFGAVLYTVSLLMAAVPAFAGSDDFNDNIKDPAKWGNDIFVDSSTNAVLTETDGHLVFTGISSDVDSSGIIRPWIAELGSYTQNWEASLDVNLGSLSVPQGAGIQLFLAIALYGDETLGNHFSIGLGVDADSDQVTRTYEADSAANGMNFFTAPAYGEVATSNQQGTVRIAFDASTKTLFASYDGIPLASLDVDAATTGWGMSDSSNFVIAVGGSMWGDFTNSSSLVYADNFELRSGNDLSYLLTVNDGTGGGEYTNGTSVSISAAEAPTGQIFTYWTGSTQYVADALSADTAVIMPAQSISLTPSYKLIGTVSGDDFDDGSKDPAKWGNDQYFSAETNMTLQEVNGRLEVLKQSGLDAFGVFRPWIESTGSYTQDWETAVNLHLSDLLLNEGSSASINLAVANQDDATFGDSLTIGMTLSNTGDGNSRGYEVTSKVDGNGIFTVPEYGYITTADSNGLVRVAFDSSTKILSASYNGAVLGQIDVDDAASNWGMTTGSVFGVAIAGSVNNGSSVGLSSGDMYADDFSITFPESPEFSYVTNNGEIIITAYIGSSSSVDIPDRIDGLPVTTVADSAFDSCTNVTSVVVGTNITAVGNTVFSGCTSLKAVCFDGDAPTFGTSIFVGTSGVLVYRLSEASGWADTLDGSEVRTVYSVADRGLAMSCDFDGTSYLVGIENQNTDPPTLEAQFLSADGTKVGEPLSTGRTGISTAMAFDGTNYLMVWEDDGLGTLTNGSYQIYGQFISPSGTTNGAPFAITSTGIWFDGIHVMEFGGGKYLVTCTRLISPELGADPSNRYISGRIVDPASGPVGSEFRISTGYGQESDVAFDGSNFFVVWCEDYSDYEIRGCFVSPSGELGTEISVNDSAWHSDNPKAVAFDGKNYLVVWNDEIGGHGSEIWAAYGQLVSTNGTLVGDVIPVATNFTSQLVTGLAFDGAHYLAIWSDMSTDGDWDMYGQYIGTSGALIGEGFPLMNCGDNQLGGTGFANGKYIVLANDGITVSDDSGTDWVDASYALFVTPPEDGDSNSLPDLWEMEYFGTTGINPENFCSNGVNKIMDAYVAGFDPTDPYDAFRITGGDARTGALEWNAVSGRVYAVYWSTNLINGFQCLESNILWNAGTFTDSVHRAENKCFYKLDVRLEQ